jgi:folylpolyglutamate synthase/dihydropteroate synthase
MRPLGAFWAEWDRRTPGETRRLERARLLVNALGIEEAGCPLLTVVGSKGKGTAATYGSAYLAATGARIVTVTSPSLRGVRDRIRVNGRAIAENDLTRLAARLDGARRTLPPYRPGEGYLSPSGLFIIAGVLHAQALDADMIVLEAGMGGASDEVSLFGPTVVGVTSIFGEHLGVLGDTPAEIATDKAGVVAAKTRIVVSMPQDSPVERAITSRVAAETGGLATVETIKPGASGIPAHLLPRGLGRFNAELGCVAAQRLLDVTGRAPPPGDRLQRTLSTVALPGRASWHDVPGTNSRLFADAAITRAGIAAALTEVFQSWDAIDHVLVCMPDHKDVAGTITELAGLRVTFVRLTDKPRLNFTQTLPPDWEIVDIDQMDRHFLAARGGRLVALGTGYFIARVLDLVDADTEQIFIPPGEDRNRSA